MYSIDFLAVGVAVPLLAYATAAAWNSVASYRARNMSASLRTYADEQLALIESDDSAPKSARDFAQHLRRLVADSDAMVERGVAFLELQPENEKQVRMAKAFRESFGKWAERFEEIFPVLTTACLLLHPYLGRVYYRTFLRTSRVIKPATHVEVGSNANVEAVAPPLLVRGRAHSEDATWMLCAA